MRIALAPSPALAILLAAALLHPLFAPPLLARTRKGDKFLAQGRAAEAKMEWDQALLYYEQALSEDPTDAAYIMVMRKARFQAGQLHVDIGQRLRNDGKLVEAMAEFQKAYAIDPSSMIAEQEIRRTQEMIDMQRRKEAKPEDAGLSPAQIIRREAEERIGSLLQAPELRPINRQPITLKMNNQPPRILFETIAKLAGVNIVFDSEYQAQGRNFTLDLTNATLEEALDYVAVQTKSFWKPLSPNTIFVTQDNVTKRRDYEDLVVKTFYLSNTTTAQELQEIATAVRSVTEIRRVFTYNAQNAILVRGTVDQVALAEKLILDLDKPKSEVVVDVVVMEVNTARTRDLALSLVSGGNPGLNIPVSFTPRNPVLSGSTSSTDTTTGNTTTTTSTAISLAQIGRVSTNDFSLTLPGAIFNAVLSDRGTRVMQSPQVRAVELQKASLRIGDKIPYATGSFQPGVGTIGVSPLVSTQFNFAEVGVNVDITPKVHGPEEVSLHVEIEISSVRDRVDIGGISQPVIGQRKVVHDIRIKEGEVNLLGGLLQTQESKSVNGFPGINNIPGLRRLFSSEKLEKNEGELLIALIPHIVRAPEFNAANLRGVAAGNDTIVKLNYAPRREPEPEPKPAAPAKPGAEVKPGTEAPKPTVQELPPPAASLGFDPPVVSGAKNDYVWSALQVNNATDLFSAPMRIKYDPKVLELTDIIPGNALAVDGKKIAVIQDMKAGKGEAAVTISRQPGDPGLSASGPIVLFRFKVVGKGSTQVTFTDLQLKNSRGLPLSAAPPALTVTAR